MTYLNHYGRMMNEEDVIPPVPKDVDMNKPGWWKGDFIVIKEQPDELTIKSTNFEKGYPILKIKPKGFKSIGVPKFLLGDVVVVVKKRKVGRVYSVVFHDKRNCFRYMLDYGDRKSTCWYFDEDLNLEQSN